MATRVTVENTETGETQSAEITDHYVLVVDGSAQRTGVQLHRLKDGTETHVITVKGCKR